jgi:hypothetical protein
MEYKYLPTVFALIGFMCFFGACWMLLGQENIYMTTSFLLFSVLAASAGFIYGVFHMIKYKPVLLTIFGTTVSVLAVLFFSFVGALLFHHW